LGDAIREKFDLYHLNLSNCNLEPGNILTLISDFKRSPSLQSVHLGSNSMPTLQQMEEKICEFDESLAFDILLAEYQITSKYKLNFF
jgi:hypothetical protein